MHPFELALPENLAAVARAAGPNTLLKAAGIDVLDRLKERVEAPEKLIDLLRLAELRALSRADDGAAVLGALTTLQEIADAEVLAEPGWQVLREAAGHAATPQVRARATLGGNLLQKARCWYLRSAAFGCLHGGDGPLCQAMVGEHRYHAVLGALDCIRVHPSNTAPALVVLGAEVEVQNGDAVRRLPIRALFPEVPSAKHPEHTLADGEVLVRVHLPAASARGRSAWRETREKQSNDWPTTAAAVHVTFDGDTVASAAICLGAVAPVPWPADEAARLLEGEKPSAKLVEEVVRVAYEGAVPLAKNAWKIDVGRAALRDALNAALGGS